MPAVSVQTESSRASLSRERMVLIGVIGLAAVLRLFALATENHQSPDTYQYVRQTSGLLANGLSFLRQEAAQFLHDPRMAEIPTPVRTLWLCLLAGWFKLTQTSGVQSIATFACLMDVLATAALALVASEALGTGAAIVATLLYAVSPLALSIARHGWAETTVSLLGLLFLLLAGRALARPRPQRWLVALGALAGLSFALKETAFLAGIIVVAINAALLLHRRETRAAIQLAATWLSGVLAALCWNAYALGGFSTALALVGVGRDVHGVVAYARLYQTGTVPQWIESFFLADPVLTTCAIAGTALAVAAFRETLRERPLLLVAGAVCVVFVALPTLGPSLYNLRWVASVYAPGCLLAGSVLQRLWERLTGHADVRRWMPLALCVLIVFAAVGIWRYQALIAAPDLADLSLKMILDGHN